MVIDLQLLVGGDFARDDVQAFRVGVIAVCGDHVGHEFVGVYAGVLGEDAGENFEGFSETTVTVLIESCEFLSLGLELLAEDLWID